MLDNYSQINLKKVKHVLEKFFYTAGTNIAFYNASRQPKFRDFKDACKDALTDQIRPFYKESNVKAVAERVPQDIAKIDDIILDVIISAIIVSFPDLIRGKGPAIDDFLIWAGRLGGQASFDKVGIDLTFKLFNPEVVSKLRDRRTLIINSVDNTTKEWIAKTIAKGVESGLSHAEIAKQIEELGEDMTKLRARKIVETEVANAMGLVELESIKRNGSVSKRWITSRDERVCSICLGNEQQGRIPINEKFVSGVEHVPGHVFCRCYLEGTIPPDIPLDKIWTGD